MNAHVVNALRNRGHRCCERGRHLGIDASHVLADLACELLMHPELVPPEQVMVGGVPVQRVHDGIKIAPLDPGERPGWKARRGAVALVQMELVRRKEQRAARPERLHSMGPAIPRLEKCMGGSWE
jgi:hypothetical protein